MTRISANELLSRLEKGKAIPAILLLGEEPYLRDRCRALLMERYVPDAARPWAVSRYSADRRETQAALEQDRKSTRLNSSHLGISYAVFCLKKKKKKQRMKQRKIY